jgi:predicted NBD/HSP70 family sugar kinase
MLKCVKNDVKWRGFEMSKGTALLRQQNEKRTLAYLRTHKTSSRLEIAKSLGLSKNTISLIIDKFIKEGIVRETGLDEQVGVGRPRIQLALVPENYKAVGILVQDTQAQYVVTDYTSRIVEMGQFDMESTLVDSCLERLHQFCLELLERHPETLGIGIGIPGLVDPNMGVVHYSSHLGWRNVPVKNILGRDLPVPLRIMNSVKAAALSPIPVLPEGHGSSAFYMRIEEGVGGALIIGKDIYNGASWTAGEVGHIPVLAGGPLCKCGQRGCLESLVSIPVIVKQLRERYSYDTLTDQPSDFLKHVLARREQDPILQEVLQQAGAYVGNAISQVINLLNPQFVIIDSPFERSDRFQQAVKKAAEEKSLQVPYKQATIVFVETHYSSATGAALAVILDFESDIGTDMQA